MRAEDIDQVFDEGEHRTDFAAPGASAGERGRAPLGLPKGNTERLVLSGETERE